MLYTLAPDLLIGWPRANRPEEREFLLPDIGSAPGDRPHHRARQHRQSRSGAGAQARSHSRCRLDQRRPCVARRARAGADRHSLCAARRPLCRDRDVLSQARRIDRRVARRARTSPTTPTARSTTITERIANIAPDKRPRVYYARGPRGLETGLGGSINVETIELLARNVAGERKGGLATVSIEQVLLWNPDVIITIDRISPPMCGSDPAWIGRRRGADRARASFAEAAVRLGRFPAVGQPADRAVVAGEDSLSGALPGGHRRA